MFKRAIVMTLALLLAVQPVTAPAASLSQAFSNLLSGAHGADPSVFASRTRMGVSLGSVGIHFPRQTVSLFSLTPPNIQVGCGGISLHLGGFSFINGQQIQEMLERISAGAVAYVMQAAIGQLCPLCEKISSWAAGLQQLAAKSSIDSCVAGAEIVKYGISKLREAKESFCKSLAAEENRADDYLSAAMQCTAQGNKDADKENIKAANEMSASDVCASPEAAGNTTWCVLKGAGLAEAEEYRGFAMLVMSMIGTQIRGEWKSPLLGPKDALGTLMCGISANHDAIQNQAAKNFCENIDPGNLKMYLCKASDDDGNPTSAPDYEKCSALKDVTIAAATAEEPGLAGATTTGFIPLVGKILHEAVEAVKDDNDIPDNAKYLIQVAPFPLYQVINLGATYPALAHQIIDENTVVLAYLLAIAYIDKINADAQKAAGQFEKVTPLSREMAAQVIAAQHWMYEEFKSMGEHIDFYANRQAAIMAKVNAANREMMRAMSALGINGLDFARGALQ